MTATTGVMLTSSASKARWRRWLNDPFFHFVVIGCALFALYALASPPAPPVLGSRIELTDDDLRQIELAWTAKWGRAPTTAERGGLLEAKVREEILYREAMAMGLDQEDTIIKRRMAQKLEFLTEDLGAIRTPSNQELRTWFEANKAQFATVGYITFRHLYFSPDKRGAEAARDAASALVSLEGQNADGPLATRLGDRFPDRTYFAEQSREQIANVFGTSFSDTLQTFEPGRWQGPIESGLGWHLVWVDSITPGNVPAFGEVDAKVLETAWIDAQRARSKQESFRAMRARYDVVLPGSAER